MFDDKRKIGAFLSGFGFLFIVLGVILLFDRGLIAIGNLAFLIGLGFIIGFRKAMSFFWDRKKIMGTLLFIGGILMVLFGWVFIGLPIEIFGFINLFGNFIPIALAFMRRMPVIGFFLNLPVIRSGVDRIINKGKLPV